MKSYRPRTPRNIADWNYVQAALVIGHTLEKIAKAMPHNPGFVNYAKRNGWLAAGAPAQQ